MSMLSELHIVKVFVGSRVDEVLLRVQFVNTSGRCFRKGTLAVEMPIVYDEKHEIARQEENINILIGDETKKCLLGLEFIDSSGMYVGKGILHMERGEMMTEEALYNQMSSGQICELFCPCHRQGDSAMSWENVSHQRPSPATEATRQDLGLTSEVAIFKVEKVFDIDLNTKHFNLKTSSVTVKYQDNQNM